jgi:hypothetical protein
MKWFGLMAALALITACGPTFSQARLASYPPRSDNCELDFVDATRADMSPGGKWRVIGYVSIEGLGKVDPMSPQNKELVRPRICQLGGVAVAVAPAGMEGTPTTSGSAITYAALRLSDEPIQHHSRND